MSDWISVEDGLPDEDCLVFVTSWRYQDRARGRFYLAACRFEDKWIDPDSDDRTPIYRPTHWMKIEPPEES